MSRVGKQPIPITDGAKIAINGRNVSAEGKLGKLEITMRPEVSASVEDNQVLVERSGNSKTARAMHGLTRALIANMIVGVTKGYSKKLLVSGVGYTAQLKGKEVHLKVGFADTRIVKVPMGVDVKVEGSAITVTGCDKQLVGQVAAAIREHRKPEPYNAKGISYEGERVIRKQGKAFGK